MFNRGTMIQRKDVGTSAETIMEMPNLIDVQVLSYENFLQFERIQSGKKPKLQGLEQVFINTFPIESSSGDMTLSYEYYTLDTNSDFLSEAECKAKGKTYALPLKARINLHFRDTGEIRQKDIYMGDIPIMTDRGTFIYNGAERVIVSQIHRSPGVVFSHDKGVYSSRIIPYRGSWLEFEIDHKKELIYAKIDRKKKILLTMFLRALKFDTREKIISLFYATKEVSVKDSPETREQLRSKILAKDVFVENGEDKKILYIAGLKLHPHDLDELIHSGIENITIIDNDNPQTLNSDIILNCIDEERRKFVQNEYLDEPSYEEALQEVYSKILPGEPITPEGAEKDFATLFFSSRRYDLGRVGRYKLNKRFDYENPSEDYVLSLNDIINTISYLVRVYIGEATVDDIDHLSNRRVRSVGELLANQLKGAFSKLERVAKERMTLKETETIKPQDLISIKPIIASVKEFFGSSQLSQFMDQVNPLSELTHKRRLNALGPGGLTRERAGFEVRDVHYSHYGRMCPIETPEGPNIGLIVSLAGYTRVNDYGFLETPYRIVKDGRATKEIVHLSAIDEEKFYIAQANAYVDTDGNFMDQLVSVRRQGDYSFRSPSEIQYMDVSPKQVISVSASLIPFLEHDDANRALMGSNMQRQAVPLVNPEPPRVGTGMEEKTAYDSGVLIKAKRAGRVSYVSNTRIEIIPEAPVGSEDKDTYNLIKYQKTNQDTCYVQKPTVQLNDTVSEKQVLADGPATFKGELALGRNVLVGFVPWNGYNYEDAVLISEKVVKEDIFTSVHIHEFTVEVRETKLGSEKITRDIPNTSEKALSQLDENGIIRIGAKVDSGYILVGKITPKSETETTPEFKLLNSIFGEKAKEVRDSSLKIPHGVEGTVIDIQRLSRTAGDDLAPGVEEEVKVIVATKKKLQEGDKIAGRHGNKGIIARVLPEEDMPYMADGTPLELCLNPLGVPSRMNIGQLLETMLGWSALRNDEWYTTPVFQSASGKTIEELLQKASCPTSSKTILYDGKTGIPFENEVMVGCMYIIKLHHLVTDKMHARSTGPYSLVTQQPLGGKAQFGGQRLGEMEVWALEAYGAANTLQELLTIKSDDMNGRAKIYESIVKGETDSSAGIPESFNVLVQEMRGLGLDLSIYDTKGKQIPLTERDEELITRQSSNF